MFDELQVINVRPAPFSVYTASELWTDDYTSKKMIEYHLNKNIDVSSRNMKFIQQSVAWIIAEFDVDDRTKIADFGCGPGLYAQELSQAGAAVTGVDFSRRSIQYARDSAQREGLSINYVNTNYLEYETAERFDLIIMIMCDFCALSHEQRKVILKKYYSLLKPGGHVLLDVCSLRAFQERKEVARFEKNLLDGFWSSNEYYGFLNTFKYEDEKVILDKYTIIEQNKQKTVYNWLQFFSIETIKREFEKSGFLVTAHYSDVAGTPWNEQSLEIGIVAQKA